MQGLRAALVVAFASISVSTMAADYPAPKEGDWVARNFRFHTGETIPELKLHYTTVGEPSGQPVLVLHGSGGSAATMLTPTFAGELFGPGQPLDAARTASRLHFRNTTIPTWLTRNIAWSARVSASSI